MFEMMLYKLKSYTSLLMCSLSASLCASATEPPNELNLSLPQRFEIHVYAKLNVPPRMMAFGPNGHLYVSSAKAGQVLRLPDSNQDGVAEAAEIVAQGLNAPNGLAFDGDRLLIANQDSVVALRRQSGVWSKPKPLITQLPTGGHSVKTIKIGPDKHLYINVGSSCNVCIEQDPTRATILRYTLTGQPAGAIPVVGRHQLPPIWAKGLRNAQGFAWHPATHAMYATNNGADMRSDKKDGAVNDELPPEHINHIQKAQHYGWPHCWGIHPSGQGQYTDPNFPGAANYCQHVKAPGITLTSHSTPIGITFLDKSHFPKEFQQDAVVALHGSWNREQLSGYKLMRIKFTDGKPTQAVDFVTGWLANNRAWGRPVDVVVGPDGALYVSDDRTAYIYKIQYQSK